MSNIPNIIVTEDDESLNHLMQRILQREGFITTGALSGSDAIERVAETEDPLLILDYGLPDMSGKDVIQTLSRKKKDVPFLLVTGKGNQHIAVDMMKRGAKDYIIKDEGFIEDLPLKVKSVLASLDWEKDVEAAEVTLQMKTYYNQMMLDRMPYVAITFNPHTNEIITSNEAAEKAGIVTGKKCSSHQSDSATACQWCNPPDLLEKGKELESVFEASGRLWNATWIPVDDNMSMVFASDISDLKETYLNVSSKKAELRNLTDMADGIDRNLSGLKNNLSRLANNLRQIKDKSDT